MNMSERKLLGTVAVDSGQISIVDPAHINDKAYVDVESAFESGALLKVDTEIGDGVFPVYFEKDDAEGGYGKSRIIIELGEVDKDEVSVEV